MKTACPQAKGLILTGSAARDEATVVEADGVIHWLSDLEFLVVLGDSADITAESAALDRLSEHLGRRLEEQGIRVAVELTPAPERYFSSIR
ncbi:MAG TPA: hypothetical protein VLH09_08915, partial [Bryobacteraceae bacterium]|nr:hypothetical protein [Bryobacteraceae bacterium]